MKISDFNKKFGGEDTVNQAVQPKIEPRPEKFQKPKTIADFNALYADVKIPEKKVQVVEEEKGPLLGFEEKPGFRLAEVGEGTAGTMRIVTPKLTARGVFTPAGEAFNVISNSAETFTNRMIDLFDFATYEGVDTKTKQLQMAGKTINLIGAGAGLAFAPISAELTAAEHIPVLKWIAKPVNKLFEGLGKAGSWLGGVAINAMPISEESKNILREPIKELGSYAAPLVFAKVSGPALGKVAEQRKMKTKTVTMPDGETFQFIGMAPTTAAKIAGVAGKVQQFAFAPISESAKLITGVIKRKYAERKSRGITITPEESKKIVNEAVKEVPAEIPGVMSIHKVTEDGKIDTSKPPTRVHTNQKIVLQNFIKGQEDIDYKQVKNIGKDTNGNQITARFEWDYKGQRATIYVTNKSTAEDIAHELGHYFDRKLSSEIGKQFSQTVPDYATNPEPVKSALTAYAIDRLGGNASKKQIDATVGRFVEEFRPQVERLAAGEGRGMADKFAEAVKEVILRPKESLVKAPDFTGFIQHSLKREGPFSKQIKTIEAKAKPKPKVKPKPVKRPEPKEAVKKVTDIYLKKEKTDPVEVANRLGFNDFTEAFGSKTEANDMAQQFWSRGGKEGIYYHVGPEKLTTKFDKTKARTFDPANRGGISMINGLYLGKDQNVLQEFYGLGLDAEGLPTKSTKLQGEPKWLDLLDRKAEETFINDVKKKYKVKDEKSEKFGEVLEKEVLARGFDGIRYFDPWATGEEFVLVNQNALKLPGEKEIPTIKKPKAIEVKEIKAEKPEEKAREITEILEEEKGLAEEAKTYGNVKEFVEDFYLPKFFEFSKEEQKAIYEKAVKRGDFEGSFESFAEIGDSPEYRFNPKTLLPEGIGMKRIEPLESKAKLTEFYNKVLGIEKVPEVKKTEPFAEELETKLFNRSKVYSDELGLDPTTTKDSILLEQHIAKNDPALHKALSDRAAKSGTPILKGQNIVSGFLQEQFNNVAEFFEDTGAKPTPERRAREIREVTEKKIPQKLEETAKEAREYETASDFIRFTPQYQLDPKNLIISKTGLSREKIDFYKAKIQKGEPIEPVALGGKRGEKIVINDGNNRAMAFKELGMKVPAGKLSRSAIEEAFGGTLEEFYRQAKIAGERPAKKAPEPEGPKPFTGKPITTKAFNEAKINAPEDVINVLKEVAEKNKQFSEDRRATTLDEMKQFALNYLGDQNLYKNVPAAIRENIGRMKAAQQTMVDMARDLVETLKGTDVQSAGPEKLKEMRDQFLRLEQVTSAFAGARTEASHLFSSLKAEVSPGENNILRELFSEMKKAGLESKTIEDFIKKKNEKVRETKGEALVGVWYSFLLSGPTTFIKNAVSTAGSVLSEVGSLAIRKPGDVPTAVASLWTGFKDGWGIAKEVAVGKRPGAAEEAKFTKEIRRGKLPYEFAGRAEWLNKLRIVGRMLAASDTVFNEGLRQMELTGLKSEMPSKAELIKLGEQRAKGEGFSGEMIHVMAEQYAKNPDVLLGDLANQFALEGTYNNNPSGILGAVSRALGNFTREKPVGKFVVPFTRVVANVINRAIDYTPYGFTRMKTGEGLFGGFISEKLGGKVAEPKTARQQKQQLARAIIGTLFMGVGATLAADDKLSGNGPASFSKRSQLMDTGWRPNAIKIGNRWIPYLNLGPLALPLAIVGNANDALKYKAISEESMAQRVTGALAGSIGTMFEMSFLTGASDFMSIVSSGDADQLTNYMTRGLTGIVEPNLIKQVARWFDPKIYAPENVWERILTDMRVAGLTGVKPKLNVFGEEVKADRFPSLQPVKEIDDPVKNFLAKNELWVSVPGKNTQVKLGPQDVRSMTPDEYYRYVAESGPEIKRKIEQKMEFIDRQATKERKQELINDIVTTERKKVRNKIEQDARKK